MKVAYLLTIHLEHCDYSVDLWNWCSRAFLFLLRPGYVHSNSVCTNSSTIVVWITTLPTVGLDGIIFPTLLRLHTAHRVFSARCVVWLLRLGNQGQRSYKAVKGQLDGPCGLYRYVDTRRLGTSVSTIRSKDQSTFDQVSPMPSRIYICSNSLLTPTPTS
jgi:hypothetical protein